MHFVFRILLSVTLSCAVAHAAVAAQWPDRPIRIVYPFSAGSIGGMLARVVADGLSQRLGQPVIVEPRPGAGGAVGFQYVKAAQPDGYNLLLATNSTTTLLPSLRKDLPFDVVKDFDYIAMVAIGGNVIVTRADGPLKTFDDLRAAARTNPGVIYGSAGNGTTFHLMPVLFDQLNGSKMTHVPYKGASPVFMGLLAGEVAVVFGSTESLKYVEAGNLRAIAAMSSKRLPEAPTVPTTSELGMPDLVMESFYGLMAPKGMPPEITNRLNKEVAEVMAAPSTLRQLKTLLLNPVPDSSAKYFFDKVKSETARWRPVIERSGMTVD